MKKRQLAKRLIKQALKFTNFCPRKDKPYKAVLEDIAEQTKSRIKCANCDGNHTSNYRECSARNTYHEEQENRMKKPAASRLVVGDR